MIMGRLRTITTVLVLLSVYWNTLLASNELPLYSIEDPDSVFYDAEYTSQLNQLTEDDINQQIVESMLEFQTQQCMDDQGNISYSKKAVVRREDNTTEVIDCSEVAAVHFEIMTHDEQLTDRQAIACVTEGWHPEDRLDFVRELGLAVEDVLECPGKETSNLKCMGEFACGALDGLGKVAVLPTGMAANAAANWVKSTFNLECNAKNTLKTLGSCLSEMLWGVIKNVFGSLEFLVDGIKWVGNKVVDGAKWVGRKLCFWCSDEHEDASSDQQHVINSSSEIREQNTLKAQEAAEESKGIITKFMDGFKSFFDKLIMEPAGRNFGCAEWEGNRFTTGASYNIFDGQDGVPVRCKKPFSSWKCATCEQRTQMMCGMVGFLGGEVITSILTGKIVGTVAQAVTKVGKVALAGAKSMPLLKRMGKFARGGIVFLKDSKLGKYSFKVGNKSASLTKGFRSRLANMFTKAKAVAANGGDAIKAAGIVTKRAIFDSNYIGKGVKGYFNLLDDAFMFGSSGRAGLLANRAARTQAKVRNSMFLAQRKFDGYDDIAVAMSATSAKIESKLADLDDVINSAKKASGAEKKALMTRADELTKEYQGLTKQFDNEYKTALSNLKQRKAAEEAERIRLAEEAAQREREAQLLASQTTAGNLSNGSNSPALRGNRNQNGSNRSLSNTDNTRNSAQRTNSGSRNVATRPNQQVGSVSSSQSRGILDGIPENWSAMGSERLSAANVEDAINGAKNILPENTKLRGVFYDRNGERILDMSDLKAAGGRIDGFTDKTGRTASKGVEIDELGQFDLLAEYVVDGETVMHRISVNVSPITDRAAIQFRQQAASNAAMTLDEFKNWGKELAKLPPAQQRKLAGEITLKLQRGEALTLREKAIYQKSFGGYITKPNLPNADVLYRAHNATDPAEIARIYDEGIVGNSPATKTIRDSMKTALQVDAMYRSPTGLVTAGAMTTQGVVDSDMLRLRGRNSDNLPVLRDPDLPVVARQIDDASSPTTLRLAGREQLALPPPALRRGRALPYNRTGSLFAGARALSSVGNIITDDGSNPQPPPAVVTPSVVDPDNSNDINVIANRCDPKSGAKFDIGFTHTGSPIKCTTHVSKLDADRKVIRNADGDAIHLPNAEYSDKKVEVRWKITRGTGSGTDLDSSKLTLDDEFQEYTLSDGVEQVSAMLLIDGTEYRTVYCPMLPETPTTPCDDDTVVTDDDDTFDPYDREPADDGDGEYQDRAAEFFDQQRSPPPSLFQPINIPRRPTGYLHGGWY